MRYCGEKLLLKLGRIFYSINIRSPIFIYFGYKEGRSPGKKLNYTKSRGRYPHNIN
jgi:hypothetical protein